MPEPEDDLDQKEAQLFAELGQRAQEAAAQLVQVGELANRLLAIWELRQRQRQRRTQN